MTRTFLIEFFKISCEISYMAGKVVGFSRGFFGLCGEDQPEKIRAIEIYKSQLSSIIERFR